MRKKAKKEPAREKRIDMEIVVDAYGPSEQAISWYYYLEDNLKFSFPATCVRKRDISPLKIKEKVEVVGMPPEVECKREMFVAIRWEGRRFSVSLDQLECVAVIKKPNRPSQTGITGWARAISLDESGDEHEKTQSRPQ
jgi:hypothetical protein